MQPSIDIVIVNWNTSFALAACLQSIEGARSERIDLQRVVVVDNASTDESLSGLDEIDLPLCLQRNTLNRGFAAGCNQGARRSAADYLLFLNPDTRLCKDALQSPIDFMCSPQSVVFGICGIRLLDDHGGAGTCSAHFPTASSMWSEGIGLHRLAPKLFQDRLQTDVRVKIKEVDQVIGAYFLMRRSLFNQLNGFDERFFIYFEEVDISLRAHRAGYHSCILGNIASFHTGCASSDQVKDRRLFYLWRSRILYAGKHFSTPEYLAVLVLTFAVEPILRILRATLSTSMNRVLMTARAYLYLLRHVLTGGRHGYSR